MTANGLGGSRNVELAGGLRTKFGKATCSLKSNRKQFPKQISIYYAAVKPCDGRLSPWFVRPHGKGGKRMTVMATAHRAGTVLDLNVAHIANRVWQLVSTGSSRHDCYKLRPSRRAESGDTGILQPGREKGGRGGTSHFSAASRSPGTLSRSHTSLVAEK